MIGWDAGNNSYSMSRVGVLPQHWASVWGQLCLHLVTRVCAWRENRAAVS